MPNPIPSQPRFPERTALDWVGGGNAAVAYGGKLEAWAFDRKDGLLWFREFRQIVLASISQRFLPVYRMADGEYRFLVGRRYSRHRKGQLREILAQTFALMGLHDPLVRGTSWGEAYSRYERKTLQAKYIEDLGGIAASGWLALFLNDNGLHCGEEYMRPAIKRMIQSGIAIHPGNYVPFHFVVQLLVGECRQEFWESRRVLVVTSLDVPKRESIKRSLQELGCRQVAFLDISATKSMLDRVDLSKLTNRPELCLVAAGIGAANILLQLQPLHTVALDIGGFMNCLVDRRKLVHGVFRFPQSVEEASRQ